MQEGLRDGRHKSVFDKVVISKFQDNVDNLGYIIDGSYEYIMDDLNKNGKKTKHWAWFVLSGVGRSVETQIDAIKASFEISRKGSGPDKA